MASSGLLDDITTQLASKGYEVERRLATNQQLQTYTFLTNFTGDGDPEQRVVKVKSMLTLPEGENTVEKKQELEHREVDILRTLSHPRIPSVRDVFDLTYQDVFDLQILALQYVEMPNLEEVRIDGRQLTERNAITILDDCLDALSHAHENDIYHRDIKPSNILFGRDTAYLIDFNLGKVGSDKGSSFVDNSFGYYPIDAFSGRKTSSQDLCAMGNVAIAVAYGMDISEIRSKQRKGQFDPVDLDDLRFSPKFVRYLQKLTTPNPALRYQTAEQALDDLRHLDAMSEEQLDERLSSIVRSRGLTRLLERLSEEDKLFEFHVPIGLRETYDDDSLIEHLEKIYTRDEFIIEDPEQIVKYVQAGDVVVKRGNYEKIKLEIKKRMEGKVKSVNEGKLKVAFNNGTVEVDPIDVEVYGDRFSRWPLTKKYEESTSGNEFFKKWRDGHLVRYTSEEPIIEYKYLVADGTRGVVTACDTSLKPVKVVWERGPGVMGVYHYGTGSKKDLSAMDIWYEAKDVRLVRKNHINFDALQREFLRD